MAQRMRLGELAVSRGFLTQEELEEAFRTHEELFREGKDKTLGEVLVEKGYLRQAQLEALARLREEEGKKRIGPYELLAWLGEGGMGAVYKARDERSGGLVAVKVLSRRLAQDAEFAKRFEREGRLGLELDHPNVVRTLELGEGEGPGGGRYRYIAMEYVEGTDVDDVLEARGRLEEREALEIAMNVSRGLHCAHQHGLVHRDIKPSNILLARDGRILLADLGLARSTEDSTRVTATGAVVGTPHYLSPEQARSEREIDIRSDIYSLGAALYHMLTGEVPFEAANPAVVVMKRLTDQLPSPRELVPELSEGASRLVEKMMAKKPEDRYADPEKLAGDIELVLEGGLPTARPRPGPGLSSVRPYEWSARSKRDGPRRVSRRRARTASTRAAAARENRVLPLAAGVLGAAFFIGVAVAVVQARRRPAPAGAAQRSLPGVGVAPLPEITLDLGGGVTLEMVYIKPGRFMMGSKEGKADEKPVHEVVITQGFYLGKYEVTRGQFAAFVRATNHVTEAERLGWAWAHKDGKRGDVKVNGVSWRNLLYEQTDDHPVACVSWDDAKAFCDWLGKKTGRPMRLPTEAEWEYAARAGSSGSYCFGSEKGTLGDYAWYRSNSDMRTHPAGEKKPNAWGLYDMHGNVCEWCADWCDRGYYEHSPRDNPQGPATGTRRALRGGSWRSSPNHCRSAARFWEPPALRGDLIGFRVAASAAPLD